MDVTPFAEAVTVIHPQDVLKVLVSVMSCDPEFSRDPAEFTLDQSHDHIQLVRP